MATSVHTNSTAAPRAARSVTSPKAALLQRCACGGSPSGGGECEECRKRRLQRRAVDGTSASGALAPPIVHDVLRSEGNPLAPSTREFFESRLGHDFGDVRVHNDARGGESARAVSALAYTVGSDVVFAPGRYSPTTNAGMELLGHELTHVVQQSAHTSVPSDVVVAPPGTTHEREAESFASQLSRSSVTSSGNAALLQRQPQPALRDQLCYQPGSVPAHGAGECDAPEPENCVSYEQWIATYGRLRSFAAGDTAPGGQIGSGHLVLGERAATRPVDVASGTAVAAADRPPAFTDPVTADRFIDHPTNQWVQTCLAPNLRPTAYALPTDCADVAVILRHVWLAAHGRTEAYGQWVVGARVVGEQQRRLGRISRQIFSGNAARTINAYSDARGNPLRTFAALQNLLHPGDVMVWEHHSADRLVRSGGDVETIRRIERQPDGRITRIELIQGNQPINTPQSDDIRSFIGRGAPSRNTLNKAAGRRIEVHDFVDLDLRDTAIPPRPGASPTAPQEMVWTWADGHTTLVAAGPPRAAVRPTPPRVGGQRLRTIGDWLPVLRRADLDTLPGVLEATLLELRSLVERGQTGFDADATSIGQAAGEVVWRSARRDVGLAEESHFRPLERIRGFIHAIGDPTALPGVDSSETPDADAVRQTFERVEEAFVFAARGATTISFTRRVRRGTDLVQVLVTGFDPFEGTGAVPPGTINPSGAAALMLDGTTVSAGGRVSAAVEGVVLPVNFEDFRRGLVERIVRPLVQNREVDSVITVSLDPNVPPTTALDIERFVVGVHHEHEPGSQTEAIPAATGGSLGPAIIEASAPVEDIARETARPRARGVSAIAEPTVDTGVTFTFGSTSGARRALRALGLPETGGSTVLITDVAALQRIVATMQRAPNGTDITFTLGRDRFSAAVVSGPGGDFLSNEVSYRVLRLLAEQGRADLPSFHVHTPPVLPNQGTAPARGDPNRRRVMRFALDVRDRIVATLRSMIAAVARRVAAARGTGP
jgi:pyrrolidone-carboxylate peptidase